jgi:hypothetical protein
VVFGLEPVELLVLELEGPLAVEVVEEEVELDSMALESTEPIVLETEFSSESIGTTILELSADLILFSTLEKSKPQLEQ